MAISESLLLAVPERLKVWVITSRGDQTVPQFLRANKSTLRRELFRGFSLALPTKLVSWLAWDLSSKTTRQWYRAHTGRYELTLPEQLGFGMVTSLCTLPLVQPLDFLKTRMQVWFFRFFITKIDSL
jgi:hypothetical protein